MVTDEQLKSMIKYYQDMNRQEERALDWASVQPSLRNDAVLSALEELQQRRRQESTNFGRAESLWSALMLGKVSVVPNEDGTFSIIPKKG